MQKRNNNGTKVVNRERRQSLDEEIRRCPHYRDSQGGSLEKKSQCMMMAKDGWDPVILPRINREMCDSPRLCRPALAKQIDPPISVYAGTCSYRYVPAKTRVPNSVQNSYPCQSLDSLKPMCVIHWSTAQVAPPLEPIPWVEPQRNLVVDALSPTSITRTHVFFFFFWQCRTIAWVTYSAGQPET